MSQEAADGYVPGVCNINAQEVAYRRKWRDTGFVVAALLFGLLYAFGVSQMVRIVVFLPLFIGIIGYYQTKHHFCVSYGAAGIQNATAGSTSASKVQPEQARVDRLFARKLNLKAAGISTGITAVLICIPNI